MKRSALIVGLLAPFGWLVPAPTHAQSDHMERQVLSQQRAQVEADFVTGKRECEQHFVVTRCVDALQERRRSALAGLRQQEVELDDRRRAADAKLAQQRLQDKLARAAARSGQERSATSTVLAASAPLATAAPAKQAASQEAGAALPASPASLPSERGQRQQAAAARVAAAEQAASAAAQRAAARQQRQREAAERRERVELRNAERAAQGKSAAPLPDPSAASAPRR